MSKPRVVVLGAGFAGLEIATVLSETLGTNLDLTLIDRSDAFVFGFSKLDVIFGNGAASEVCLPYRTVSRSGVRWCRESVLSIDPANRSVTTDRGHHEADFLVVALGADYDLDQTVGLRADGNEFYTLAGAERAQKLLSGFRGGRVVIGVVSAPYKCPPAPCEVALLLDEFLARKGVRAGCEITVVSPLSSPLPPSPGATGALLRAFAERNILFLAENGVRALDTARKRAILRGDEELPYDLFLGVPAHRPPAVVERAGLGPHGWVKVDPRTLATPFPGVYAAGDVVDLEIPMAGVFAEGQGRVVAAQILSDLLGTPRPSAYDGSAPCYIEFGRGEAGRADVIFPPDDSLADDAPPASFTGPSPEVYAEKRAWAARLMARWHLDGRN